MKILPSLSYDDVLLIPQYSNIKSRNDVDISCRISKHINLKYPIISANMSDVTGLKMAVAMGKFGALGVLPRFNTIQFQADLVSKVKAENVTVGAAIGIKNGMIERARALIEAGADVLVLDVAHGHMQQVLDAVSDFKNQFKNIDLIAGNSATYEAAAAIFRAGADCVKVGIGPGSICTTRIETGAGVPQITAILESARAARKFGKYIIADGGVKNSGDIVKGLAAGASAIMAGNILAGTNESPGQIVEIDNKKYKSYNGSTSLAEKIKHIKKESDKFNENYKFQIEGISSLVPVKGSVLPVLEKYAYNIRSGLSYSGAKNIQELWKKARFTQITSFGRRESEAHDVLVNLSEI